MDYKLDELLDQMDVEYKEQTLAEMRQNQEAFAFYLKLCNMTERVKVFNDFFCNRRPYFDKHYMRRKRRKLKES